MKMKKVKKKKMMMIMVKNYERYFQDRQCVNRVDQWKTKDKLKKHGDEKHQ